MVTRKFTGIGQVDCYQHGSRKLILLKLTLHMECSILKIFAIICSEASLCSTVHYTSCLSLLLLPQYVVPSAL